MSKTAVQLIEENDAAKVIQEYMKPIWERCTYHCIPFERYLIYSGKNDSTEQLPRMPIMPIGIDFASAMASGLYANLISRNDKMFALRTGIADLDSNDEVQKYLARVTNSAIKQIQNSNFRQQMQDVLKHHVVLGTDCLTSRYSKKDSKFIFGTVRPWNISIVEDADGLVNHIYMEIEYTAVAAVNKFGMDNVSSTVLDHYNNSNAKLTKTTYLNCVVPRDEYVKDGKKKVTKEKKYASYWVDTENAEIIEEGGHDSLPYHIARSDVQENSPYGHSRAMDALAALSTIDKSFRMIVDAAELQVKKPIWMPTASRDGGDIRITPGAINYYNSVTGGDVPQPLDVGSEINDLTYVIDRAEMTAKNIFFVDLFRIMQNQKTMTATEVDERVDEAISAIASIINHLEDEFLTGVIERIIQLMRENNLLPQEPSILKDKKYQIRFTTRLDYKMAKIDARNTHETVLSIVDVYRATTEVPQIRDVINIDAVARETAFNNDLDPDFIYTEDETKELRQAEEQRFQQQQALEMANAKVGTFDPGKKPEDGSPLSQDMANANIPPGL